MIHNFMHLCFQPEPFYLICFHWETPRGGYVAVVKVWPLLRFVYSVARFSFIIVESFFTSKTPKNCILGYNKCSIKA